MANTEHLFSPISIRSVKLRNRIAVSPMCQYSSEDGFANDWHLVHLGSRAVGGAGLVMMEATAVEARGRISPQDLGLWKDDHIPMLARIVEFIHAHGAAAGIQLAHAGRKASCYRPWDGDGAIPADKGGWTPIGPSPIPFADNYARPEELTEEEIRQVIAAFGAATRRALEAGFKVVEIHAAHGYLLHEFLSPLSNQRRDQWGGSLENRTRLAREVIREVRRNWPDHLPLLMRVSCTDWTEGGWTVDESVELARQAKELGVDLVDCSSGGNVAHAHIPVGPGYQTGFADRIRREAGICTSAVGMITSPAQADHIIRTGQADLVVLAREMLRDPYWPLHAARHLHHDMPWPQQYDRARN
jgi:2,4-dienoyl-CoA reductase-like NADH-dependent reductase (Old Yellow Enzyme family)